MASCMPVPSSLKKELPAGSSFPAGPPPSALKRGPTGGSMKPASDPSELMGGSGWPAPSSLMGRTLRVGPPGRGLIPEIRIASWNLCGRPVAYV